MNRYREKRTCTQKAFWWRSFVCEVDEVNRKTYQGLIRDTDVTHASCSSSWLPHFVLVQACSPSQPKIDEVWTAVLARTGQDTWKPIYSSDEHKSTRHGHRKSKALKKGNLSLNLKCLAKAWAYAGEFIWGTPKEKGCGTFKCAFASQQTHPVTASPERRWRFMQGLRN